MSSGECLQAVSKCTGKTSNGHHLSLLSAERAAPPLPEAYHLQKSAHVLDVMVELTNGDDIVRSWWLKCFIPALGRQRQASL